MYDWRDFGFVFSAKSDYSYPGKNVDHINRQRAKFERLFIDRVLANLGLSKGMCY